MRAAPELTFLVEERRGAIDVFKTWVIRIPVVLVFLLIGITISMSVLSVGPLVTFGFLLIPPLVARTVARNMRQFAIIGCVIGVVSALAGFCLAIHWDVPAGPTDVALLGAVYLIVSISKAVWRRIRKASASRAV